MSLVSIQFLVFFAVTLVLYYTVPKKHQWLVLLAASLFFYVQSGAKYILYILFSTLSTFYGARAIDKNNQEIEALNRRTDREQIKEIKEKSKKILYTVVILNFGILFVLKYFNFTFNILAKGFPESTFISEMKSFKLLLPLGISFYTFQSIGYLVDVHRGQIRASDHLGKFMLFVSYFPQIIQGPISRFNDLYEQLIREHAFDYDKFVKGLQLIVFGLFKKLVIADRAAVVVNHIFGNHLEYEGIVLFVGSLFYSIQIYGDFSGGIDMIRGVSETFGIDLKDNFARPYFSRSVSDFWKRWHITLGSWMTDYVFYPLALTKTLGKIGRKARKRFGRHIGKQIPAAIASFIVFILVGAWHGSSFKFVAYGIYNGIFVLSEPMLLPVYEKMRLKLGIEDSEAGTFVVFQMLRTTFIVVIGRFFSRAASFKTSMSMISRTFQVWNPWVLFDGTMLEFGLDESQFKVLFIALLILFVVSYAQEKGVKVRDWLLEQPLIFRWAIYIVSIIGILVYGYYGPSVSASDFIYQGF